MIPKFIDRQLLPHKPGVYMYKDEEGKVIYVGKAIDLYHRVASYFNRGHDNLKTGTLVSKIRSVETIVVESELEALILEANLIKKYLPVFNIRLTDDKDYLYIGITKEDFPKVMTIRRQDLKQMKKFFGPFPSSRVVRGTLKQLRRIFPWCQSPPHSLKLKPCFYYHLNLCPGACIGKISKADYNKIIWRFSRFMDGDKEGLLKELQSEIELSVKQQNFEEAQRIKQIINGITYITSTTKISGYLEDRNFLENTNLLSIEQLKGDLKLSKLPVRIEMYDISNIVGKNATGSMVVLTSGEIDKSQYRKFKINISGRPNDVGMHKEMFARRIKHQEWDKPDLILVDGGRGQVRVYQELMDQYQWEVPVYGIAKRMEWLYPPEGEIIKIPKRRLSLRLIQKIRDEAHRFAITYHRKLRSKSMTLK